MSLLRNRLWVSLMVYYCSSSIYQQIIISFGLKMMDAYLIKINCYNLNQSMSAHKTMNPYFRNRTESSNASPDVIKKAQSYYTQCMKSMNMDKQSQKDQLVSVSLFVADNISPPINMKGQPEQQLGLCATNLIKKFNNPTDLAKILQKFTNSVKLTPSIKQQLLSLSEKIEQFHHQSQMFSEITHHILGKELPYKSYDIDLQNFAWLIYIDFRSSVIDSHNIQWDHYKNTCLIASVFYFITRYSYEYTKSKIIQGDSEDKKQCILSILNYLLELFHIQCLDTFRQVTAQFDQYVNQLIENSNIYTHRNQSDFLSPLILSINIRMINNKYQKALTAKCLDYRVFKNKRMISPLRKKVKKYYLMNEANQMGLRSRKVLEEQKHFLDNSHQHQQSDDSQIMANIQVRFSTRTQWQIFRFYNLHTRGISQANIQSINQTTKQVFEETVYPVFEGYDSQIRIEAINIFHKIYFFLKKLFEEEHRSIEEQEYIFIAGESLFLVINMLEEKYCSFMKILGEVVDYYPPYQIWEVLHSSIVSCKNLTDFPLGLMQKAERQLLCEQTFKSQQMIEEINKMGKSQQINQTVEAYLKQLITEAKKFLMTLDKELLADTEQRICQDAFSLFKLSLFQQKIIGNMHLHQILLCCLYLAAKTNKYDLKFMQLSTVYDKVYPDQVCAIFSQVKSKEKTQMSLIEFYNSVFLEKAKKFLTFISESSGNINQFFTHEILKTELYPNRELSHRFFQIMDILQTSKPNEKPKNRKKTSPSQQSQQQRNETRARVRPNNNYFQNLCNTQKSKGQ